MHSHDAGRAPLIVRPPLHPTLVSFPICCLGGTLLTDIAYWKTAEMMWADFSAWLIAAGVILGWLAAIVGIVDLIGHRYATAPVPAWVYAAGNLVALVIATVNMLIHTRDAWTSIVPWGLGLSVITAIVFLFTTWIGWAALYRRSPVQPNAGDIA
jgi:uncharacterized membrane protein